jgi:hypothetical protein
MTGSDEDYLVDDDLFKPPTDDLEAPQYDALDQATPAVAADPSDRPHVPFEADEADAIEQTQAIEVDDEHDR